VKKMSMLMWALAFLVQVSPVADVAASSDELALNPNISLVGCSGTGVSVTDAPPFANRTVTGSFVGTVSAYELGPRDLYCAGYVPTESQVCISVPPGGGMYDIEVTDAEMVDSVLLIVGPDGRVDCDDDGGMHLLSRIYTHFTEGEYHVYVGTYSQGLSGNFVMTVAAETW